MRTVTYDENEWVLVPRVPTREMLDAYLANSARFSSARSDWYVMLAAAPAYPATAGDAEDAARLNWLDATNAPFRMGWKVGAAPAGNVTVSSVIQLGQPITSIRAAIDAAMRASKGGE